MKPDLDQTMDGIRLVSWDVDGTLFSHARVSLALIHHIVQMDKTAGWKATLSVLRNIWRFHTTVEKQRQSSDSKVIASQLERFTNAYEMECRALDDALHRIQPRYRAIAMLQRFSSAHIPQVALSDFESRFKLNALGINGHFAETYSCHRLGFWKPSPVPFAKIQQDFGIRPYQHLHIGDRIDTDGEACARNGCRFLLIDQLPRPWKTFNRICAISALE